MTFARAFEPLSDGVLEVQVQALAPWSGLAIVHGFDAKVREIDAQVHGIDVTVAGDTHWFFVIGRLRYQVLYLGPERQLPDDALPATLYVTDQHGFVAVRLGHVPARPGV